MLTVNPDAGLAGDYIWLNFNDFPSGLITLFSMMLFNNWQFIWDQFDFMIESTGRTNGFFLTFMVLAAYIIINILVAFVIDVYTQIERSQRKGIEERKAIIEYGRKAINAENKMKLATKAISAFKWAGKKKKAEKDALLAGGQPVSLGEEKAGDLLGLEKKSTLEATQRPSNATVAAQAKFMSALKKKGPERNFSLDQVPKKEQTNQTILDENDQSKSSDSSSEELEEDH